MITARVASSDVAALQAAEFYVTHVQEAIVEEIAPPPFTTATLLQDATTRFGWSSSQVMQTAQSLFENGLITYPRTDSISISPEASEEARRIAISLFGKENLNSKVVWNQMEGAHEAIRPTSTARVPHQLPEEIGSDERQLYGLIWKRFIAWFMVPATYRVYTVDMESDEDPSQ